MNKEEFLSVLRKNLSVLEEGEINDIIEEYEQHIDMKMKGGLSEKDAIRDFGDMKELTAGILEAYHVKADFSKEEKKNVDFSKVVEESRKATSAIGKGTSNAGKWIGKQAKRVWEFIKKPFVFLKEEINVANEKRVKNKEKKTENMGGIEEAKNVQQIGFFGKIGVCITGLVKWAWTSMKQIVNWMWKAFKWAVRWCWTIGWCFILLMVGAGTLCCIFLFGTVFVLQLQKYPLIGVNIAIIGAILVHIAGILLCLLVLKKKKFYKVMLGLLAGGVLLSGIGVGIAFGEYSAFTYGGEAMLPGSKHITKTVNYTMEADGKANAETSEVVSEENAEQTTDEKTYTVLMDSWFYTIIEDESIPKDEIQFKAKYLTDMDDVSPRVYKDAEDLICFSSGFEYNELREIMRFKDVLLSDVKAHKISDYQFDGTEIVEIHINPETSIEVEN